MTFKKALLFLHRWLGFITGLVVFVVSITGCIFCFQDEIQDTFCSYRKVEPQAVAYLQPSQLKAITLKRYPKGVVNYIYYYGKDRPASAIVNLGKDNFLSVYLNPYTGTILYQENSRRNFFTIVEYIHLYLLLPPKTGGLIVGTSVIIFVCIMITGIILWWPKRKSDRKRSFTIKWNAKWRRVNYDLHNVMGFYATSIAVILAITGLSIAFDWMRDGIYTTANLGKAYPAEKASFKSDTLFKANNAEPVTDRAFRYAQQRSADAQMFLIYEPSENAGTVGITAYAKSLHYYRSDVYTFDSHTGKVLQYMPHNMKSPGMKMNEMNYDIHVGQILGLTGKIIAFITSLICGSLPITGFIIWWGKRNKTKKPKPGSRFAV